MPNHSQPPIAAGQEAVIGSGTPQAVINPRDL
jgi:hypothetical protein